MDRLAILRFLLALLYWCKGNPPDNVDGTSGDSFPANWFSKLDANKDCFNLLGEGKRFYQYCKSEDRPRTANYLIQEIPTGTNHWHFRHSTDKDKVDGLCPACCAMGLLRLPVFATSGGSGKPPGINSKPPLYVVPVGESLAATLRLSWQRVSNLGTPAWEQPDQRLPRTGAVPLLVGLTWLPRRVWLEHPKEPESNCNSCGRKERLIRKTVFAPIGSNRTDADGPGREWRDPHVLYAKDGKGVVRPICAGNVLDASDAAAGQWAKIIVGMHRDQKAENLFRAADDATVHAWVVGFSTVKFDKYLEAVESLIPFPNFISNQQNPESFEKIERWQKQGKNLAKTLERKIKAPKEKASSRKHVEIPTMFAAIRPHVEGKVSAKAGQLLAGDDGAWKRAASEYRQMMEVIAQSLSPGFTTSAVQRRKQIASVLPELRRQAEPAKKTKSRKGSK